MDTTDRNYEKYWYDSLGMLVKYENRYFGDMKQGECLLTYNNHLFCAMGHPTKKTLNF
jgi:hypothetical protein